MPLTTRTNGSSGSNLITASWFNDFLNLFTGVMIDQPITFVPRMTLKPISGYAANPTLALATGTNIGIGQYTYSVTYVQADGAETPGLNFVSITTTTGNQKVSLTAIPTGPAGTTKRNIYRSVVGGVFPLLYFVASINDNVTTTYTDTTPDASLGALVPLHSTFGGSIRMLDENSNTLAVLSNDGTMYGMLGVKSWGSAPSTTPTLALQAGSGLGIGAYQYVVTFGSGYGWNVGESLQSTNANITTTTGNQQVHLTSIPLGPLGTTRRNIYRTVVGGSAFKFVATIYDNTTTTYNDSLADGSLGAAPPSHPSFGGSLVIKDKNDAVKAQIFSDGALSFDGGTITSDALGNLYLTAADPVIYTSRANGMNFGANGSTFFTCQLSTNGGIKLWNGWTTSYGFQFMRTDGTIMAEMRSSDLNFIIGGTTYYTHGGSYNTASGQAFTGFDVGECYETDQNYPAGTVVILDAAQGKLVKCTTDGHALAQVIVNQPGFCIGTPDLANFIQPVALVGRVLANTAVSITPGQHVCSDNNGGVRPLNSGEWNNSIGIAINASSNGQVGIILRPCYAQG